jgi:putative sigma-54 modulation protein
MNIQIKGTNLELTEALKSYVNDKIGHLSHYSEEIMAARVELETSSHHQSGFFRCEVNLDMPGMQVLRAEHTDADLYASIDLVVPKLRTELERHKGRVHGQDRKLARYLKTIFPWRSKK